MSVPSGEASRPYVHGPAGLETNCQPIGWAVNRIDLNQIQVTGPGISFCNSQLKLSLKLLGLTISELLILSLSPPS